MIVREATPDDVRFVCAAMRDHNAREIFTGEKHPDRLGYATEILRRDPWRIRLEVFCTDDGTPAALLGAWILPDTRQAGVQMVMTDRWPNIALSAIRHIRRTFIPFVLVPNVEAAETYVMVSERYPLEWLRLVGFRIDGTRAAGPNGEVFAHAVWTNPTTRFPHTVDAAGAGVALAP